MDIVKKIFSAVIVILSLGFIMQSCATSRNVEGAILVSGTMNLFPMEGGGCWVLEVGSMRNKEFYQLTGDESDLQKVRVEEAQVTLRVVPRPDIAKTCEIGRMAEIIEI
ncbi:MAG TPA: hypothetical protein VEC36_03695, partial [Patescibacteria group bacterium]|nr:hypothetical protein [Patescibacteria group bacterium]